MLKEISNIVKDLVGNDYLYFDTALQIKTSPHTHPLLFWAVSTSPDQRVYVMDAMEQWHEVEESSEVVISTLYQRVKRIESQYLINSN